MASRLDRMPDYISKHNPQPPVIVGNVPWADYFNALYPGAVRPWNAWHAYKYRTTGANITQALWEARERARIEWESRPDGSQIAEVGHPPVVLWLPYVAHSACLRCTWIDEGSSSIDEAASSARQHSVAHGADSEVVAHLRVPISERGGQFDEPLDRTWL